MRPVWGSTLSFCPSQQLDADTEKGPRRDLEIKRVFLVSPLSKHLLCPAFGWSPWTARGSGWQRCSGPPWVLNARRVPPLGHMPAWRRDPTNPRFTCCLAASASSGLLMRKAAGRRDVGPIFSFFPSPTALLPAFLHLQPAVKAAPSLTPHSPASEGWGTLPIPSVGQGWGHPPLPQLCRRVPQQRQVAFASHTRVY